ncbi:MAG: phosphoribosylformylglycinamidine synthase subunit PurL [Planctomycetes bacterium]|nr:phosphoribosylformylglycinamidine synthase subunit PurL [Planctomycetota bacterium]
MDPAEASVMKGALDLGYPLEGVRIGSRFEIDGANEEQCESFAWKALANQAIEEIAVDPQESIRFPVPSAEIKHTRTEVDLDSLDDDALLKYSVDGCLSLTLEEMKAIRDYFKTENRNPTDIELETFAQTWSEHCVHKTFKGIIAYDGPDGERIIDNLLKETVAKVTHELDKEWCISVFTDNSGIIEFDQQYGVCLKVETHNHPSAIEPYGGANTGMGGVIRDILGTGLGAKPIFNTNVFCFGDLDVAQEDIPPGTIHPRHLMRRVVAGVRDYGNRMGIPTVNGCLRFDPRYVGNPLVYCGTAGLIPREQCFGDAEKGDHILVIGGRTGRDGIHGATFSSIELSEDSEMASSGAVQIGNAIEEKKVADTFLQARDKGYFRATTDCGAGGISSAIGEMGEKVGCEVHLDRMPLKYDGLSYTEIWISEAQERLVAAVPEEHVAAAMEIFAAENVEATDVGTITGDKRLHLLFNDEEVANIDMEVLHDGIPRLHRKAVFKAVVETDLNFNAPSDHAACLAEVLGRPNIASKEWVIRQYDHEVQAGSIIKPLVGAQNDGPSDAAVVAPRLGRDRGVAVACGVNTCYSDVDAYHAAAAGIEEAFRNLVCVGAPIDKVAILDNFSWGNCDKPENLGALVRACEACYDIGMYFEAPFISGKDSLNNEYRHGDETIIIPHTLLITAMCVVEDVTKSITMDVKNVGDVVFVVGQTKNELGQSEFIHHVNGNGGAVPKFDKSLSKPVLSAVAACVADGLVTAAHDCSEGGLGVSLAEMAFAGEYGLDIDADRIPRDGDVTSIEQALYSESLSRIVITVPADKVTDVRKVLGAVPHEFIGTVTE